MEKKELEKLGEIAAALLPQEERTKAVEKHIAEEVSKLVNKLHLIKQIYGVAEIKSNIGIGVEGTTFYEVSVNTKSFESDALLHDYAQQRNDQLKPEFHKAS